MERIKKLEIKRSVENVLAGGFYTLSACCFGGAIALKAIEHPNPELAIASVATFGISACLTVMSECTNIDIKSENIRKTASDIHTEIKDLNETLREGVCEASTIEIKPLLTEEKLQSVQLDASIVEVKPLVKHK